MLNASRHDALVSGSDEIPSGVTTTKFLLSRQFSLDSPTMIFHMCAPRCLCPSRCGTFLSGKSLKLSCKGLPRRLRAPTMAVFTFSPNFIFFFQFCLVLLSFRTLGYLKPKTIKIMIVKIKLLLN